MPAGALVARLPAHAAIAADLRAAAEMRPIFFFALLALVAAAIVPRYVGQFGGTPAVPRSTAPASAQITSAAPGTGNSRLVIEPDRSVHIRVQCSVNCRTLHLPVLS